MRPLGDLFMKGVHGISQAVSQGLLGLLFFYKYAISPWLPSACRFHPTCSVYAMGAVKHHGPVRGVYLAARRLLRCHPFHPGGEDPVPPRLPLHAGQER